MQINTPMLRRYLIAFSLVVTMLVWTVPGPGQPGNSKTLVGRVIGVSDGDTIVILGRDQQQHKVRLNGIDAPEMGQESGRVAKENLSRLVFGREVSVNWMKRDRYDRLLGRVFIGSTDVNLAQLGAGLAWYYRAYESDVAAADRSTFDRVEREARAARRGLWHSGTAIPPWDYRTAARTGGSGTISPASSSPPQTSTGASFGAVRGNRNSGIYHLPDCPDYEKISFRNRVSFRTESEAKASGFRKARNCP